MDVVLRAQPVCCESHIQRNANREVATLPKKQQTWNDTTGIAVSVIQPLINTAFERNYLAKP